MRRKSIMYKGECTKVWTYKDDERMTKRKERDMDARLPVLKKHHAKICCNNGGNLLCIYSIIHRFLNSDGVRPIRSDPYLIFKIQ